MNIKQMDQLLDNPENVRTTFTKQSSHKSTNDQLFANDLHATGSQPSCIRPGASESYRRYGVTRSFIHSLAINNFHFPAQYIDTLESYFILHWKPEYFRTQIFEGSITLHNGTKYLVVYQNCNPYSIAKSAQDIRLSFRKPNSVFNIPPYVIVRLYNE